MIEVPDRYVGWKKLQLRWANTPDSRRHTGTHEPLVKELESYYSLSFPPDFREYLLKTVPASGTDHMDDEYVDWWSFDRIKNIPDEYEHEIDNVEISASASKYLFFADYLFWCWAWAICCEAGPNYGKVVVINGVKDRFVADSFEEFVELSLTNIDVLN